MRQWHEGDNASFSKTITEADVLLYSALSGDRSPLPLDPDSARDRPSGQRPAQGLLVASLISAVIGNRIPGPGADFLRQSLRFLRPAFQGDTVTATAAVTSYDRQRGLMVLETVCRNQEGEALVTGEVEIRCPPWDHSLQPG
jgi:3-hydroxybutyryl-CoA dehydratase